MKDITIKSKTLIHPLFFLAIGDLQAKELPIPLMKQARKIVKKLSEELKGIQEDTDTVIRDVFGTGFTKAEVIALIRAGEEKQKEKMDELKFSPEKQEEFINLLPKFNEKAKQLGEEEITIPFPKIELPESLEFRTDYATILEDVINLE